MTSVATSIAELLGRNRRWAQSLARSRPAFLPTLAEGQSPGLLWIGCCDSRVVPSTVLDLELGDVFVHTNIANLVKPDDTSVLSVLEFALDHLGVDHVVVCGHTRCGGVQAAVDGSAEGRLAEWVRPVRDWYLAECAKGVEFGDDPRSRLDQLCRLNVVNQVSCLLRTEPLRRAWESGGGPEVHGWLYRVEDGMIEELCRRSPVPASVQTASRASKASKASKA